MEEGVTFTMVLDGGGGMTCAVDGGSFTAVLDGGDSDGGGIREEDGSRTDVWEGAGGGFTRVEDAAGCAEAGCRVVGTGGGLFFFDVWGSLVDAGGMGRAVVATVGRPVGMGLEAFVVVEAASNFSSLMIPVVSPFEASLRSKKSPTTFGEVKDWCRIARFGRANPETREPMSKK